MRKAFKTCFCVLLACSMLAGAVACGRVSSDRPEPVSAGAQDLRTVKLFGQQYRAYDWCNADGPNVQDYYSVQALNEDLAERGLRIEWEAIENASYQMTLQMRIASGDKYGMLVNGSTLSDSEALAYGKDGRFANLRELYGKYDADGSILNFCDANFPNMLNTLTTEDGLLFWMPYLNSFKFTDDKASVTSVMTTIIRKDWIEKLGFEIKYEYSTDEYFDLLKAFRDMDVNGNGVPDENIGCSFADFDTGSTSGLSESFGLFSGFEHPMGTAIERKNGVREWGFVWESEYIAEYLDYLNKLYAEGIYDLDLLNDGAVLQMRNENRGATSIYSRSWAAVDQEVLGVDDAHYAPIRVYYMDPSNSVIVSGDIVNAYASKYMVPSNLTDGEFQSVVDLLKYVYTTRYIELMYGGIEGVGFHYTEYGELIRDFDTTMNKDKVHLDAPLWHCISGNLLPNVFTNPISIKRIREEMLPQWQAENNYREIFQYDYKYVLGGTYDIKRSTIAYSVPTDKEAEDLARVTNTLSTYSKELLLSYITGDAALNDLPKYIEEMNTIGMKEYKDAMSARYFRSYK